MEDIIASIIEQANALRQTKIHPAIVEEVRSLLSEADSLVDDALHLATTFDPEA